MNTRPPKLKIGKAGSMPDPKAQAPLAHTLSGALPPLMQLLGQTAPNSAPPQPEPPQTL